MGRSRRDGCQSLQASSLGESGVCVQQNALVRRRSCQNRSCGSEGRLGASSWDLRTEWWHCHLFAGWLWDIGVSLGCQRCVLDVMAVPWKLPQPPPPPQSEEAAASLVSGMSPVSCCVQVLGDGGGTWPVTVSPGLAQRLSTGAIRLGELGGGRMCKERRESP